MKEILWNIAPRNPVQTRYARFMQAPWGQLSSLFTDSEQAFRVNMDSRIKGRFENDRLVKT